MEFFRLSAAGMLVVASSLMTACGGGQSSSNDTSASLSGSVVKGPVDGASVCAFVLTALGKGDSLGCTFTKPDGSYSFDLPYQGPVVIEATGGTYTDEATGVPGVTLSAPLTSVGFLRGSKNTLMATPLTALAYNRARAAGNLSLASFSSATQLVANTFGLSTDVDLTKVLPLVNAGQSNAYGDALIGVSKMLKGGANLPSITTATDLSALKNNFNACTKDTTVSVNLQTQLTSEAPENGPATIVNVFTPYPAWRTTLPASGTVNQSSCQVTINTETQVQFSCKPTSGVAGVNILAGGTAQKYTFAPEPNSYFLPSLAGERVVISGGPLRLNAAAAVYIDSGSGSLNALGFGTSGTVSLFSNVTPIESCKITSGGVLDPSKPIGGITLANPSLTTGTSGGNLSLTGPMVPINNPVLPVGGSVSVVGGGLSLSSASNTNGSITLVAP
jgi:hypothetical protein